MSDIVLTTLNARYVHSAFGLRYLLANMGDLRDRTSIVELTIAQRPPEIVERLILEAPRIVGIGVYVWNALESLQVVRLLKRLRPEITVIVGGPEVSHEVDEQEICQRADWIIRGEADRAFAELCRSVLAGAGPMQKIVVPAPPDVADLTLPYDWYAADDVANRVVYVEASRGCPFGCEFCLSSLEDRVRHVPRDRFFDAMDKLLARGARHFKFVDRTFNLDPRTPAGVLDFFLERLEPGLLLHFEVVPDRFPRELCERLSRFPAGAVQLEVGVQTFDPEVANRIGRRLDVEATERNLRMLRADTGVHVHADLIAGLPGEDLVSFARGFDRLVALGPQEIQVGLLKRLRGAPIERHSDEFGMRYNPYPPYEVLETHDVRFEELQAVRRFAQAWDRVGNSGHFPTTSPHLLHGDSAFVRFDEFAQWLYKRAGRTHAISLLKLSGYIFRYLVDERGLEPAEVATVLLDDYRRGGRRGVPAFLRPHLETIPPSDPAPRVGATTAARQGRHSAR